MVELKNPLNLIFALSSEEMVILEHTSMPRGKVKKGIRFLEYFKDYDGAITEEWLEIIHLQCDPSKIQHFNRYDSDAHRNSVRRKATTREAITKGRLKFEEDYLGKFTTYETKGHTWRS